MCLHGVELLFELGFDRLDLRLGGQALTPSAPQGSLLLLDGDHHLGLLRTLGVELGFHALDPDLLQPQVVGLAPVVANDVAEEKDAVQQV